VGATDWAPLQMSNMNSGFSILAVIGSFSEVKFQMFTFSGETVRR
jgi:hypothetical protein